jgi:hypothetical protein
LSSRECHQKKNINERERDGEGGIGDAEGKKHY